MLQSCGKVSMSRKYLNGPDAPLNMVFLDCTHLPNPSNWLNVYKNENPTLNELDCVKLFLKYKAKVKLEKLVARGIAAVKAGKPVVAQCLYGKHRSRAILELIGDTFHSSRVYYVHRECFAKVSGKC